MNYENDMIYFYWHSCLYYVGHAMTIKAIMIIMN